MGHAAAIGHTTPWGRRRIPRSAGSEGCCGRGVQLQGTRSLRADAVGTQLREIDVPAPSARRNIGCEARHAVRQAAQGTRLPRSADRGDCCGSRSSGAARVSTRAAAPYARQTRWLQQACTARRCGASSRDAGPSAAGVCKHGGAVGDGRVRTWGPSASMQSALATTHLLQPSTRKTLRALNRGKICAPCMI